MGQELRIPRAAAAFIAFQRTEHKSALGRALRRAGAGRFYDRRLLPLVEPLRRRRLERLYARDLAREVATLAPYLPTGCRRVLDIGCGVGGIDALLYARCGAPELYLLDRDGVGDVHYGFRDCAAWYNSLDRTRELLLLNGVAPEHIHTFDVGREPLPRGARFELVLSLLSWGFHYPVETYLDYVCEHLTDAGAVIIDVRRGTAGRETLASRFASLEIIDETAKYQRLRATRR